MYPSYTGLKIIHDQKVQEALEQRRLYAEHKTRKPGLLQALDRLLARFNKPVDKCIICEEQV